MKSTSKNTKNNQKRMCEEILEPIQDFIPFRYTSRVSSKIKKYKSTKNRNEIYWKRRIQQVRAGKCFDVLIAKAIREVAEEYKETIEM